MISFADTLRTLHRIHLQLGDLRERAERGPKQIKAREMALVKLQEAVAASQLLAKEAHMLADRKQLELRSGEQKINDYKGKLNAATNNREYQALKEQIAAAEMANSVLADEILESLEKVDQHNEKTKEAKLNLDKGRQELELQKGAVAADMERVNTDIERLTVELQKVETVLPADFRPLYERVVRSKGSDSMAPIEGENCSGCFQRITPNLLDKLLQDSLVQCPSCGRILYVPEDRTVGRG